MHAVGRRRTGGSRSTPLRVLLIVLLALLVIALAAPKQAKADYSVIECSPEQGQTAFPDLNEAGGGSYSIWGANDCGGYGYKLWAGPCCSANGSWRAWQINAPAGTRFATAQSVVHYGTHNGYGPMTTSDGSPGYGGLSGGAGPDQWASPVQTNASFYAVLMQCFRSPCASPSWAYVYSTSITAQVHDFHAPGVSANGELLEGGVVRGVQLLQSSATDFGGGARAITVYVNGLSSERVDFCPPPTGPWGTRYTQLKPCPDSSGAKTFSLDTEKDPGWLNGANDVRICSYDAAGNESSPCVHKAVYVDNSCPASGGTQATLLEGGADVGGKLRSQVSVRSTEAPVIRGALRSSSGNPVPGATVCIYNTIDLEDASRELVTVATTQPNGRFVIRLEPGASRKVELVYRYNAKTLEQAIKLDSTVVPTLKLAEKSVRNGQKAHFRGQLPGPNAGQRAVALQARAGRKWRTFKQLKTDEGGGFKGLYRFTQTTGKAAYIFRALVKRQGDYPYEPGSSRKRKLLVRG
jgi:hypothetical protein